MRTLFLLTISNVFMTFAWYGHLKYCSNTDFARNRRGEPSDSPGSPPGLPRWEHD